MFAVVFELHPSADRAEAYLDEARTLRPELEQIDGFIDNVRYRSLCRDGWLLSVSAWRDEKSLVRWRTRMRHHLAQEKGRADILADYHLRVGELTEDTRVPDGHVLVEQRLDETEVGQGTAIVLVTARRPTGCDSPEVLAEWLGFDPWCMGCVGWDIFEAVLSPSDVALAITWHDQESAKRYADSCMLPDGARLRRIRVVRDYGMYDRREAPQFYPEVDPGRKTATESRASLGSSSSGPMAAGPIARLS